MTPTEVLHLDDALWAWLDTQNSVNVDGRAIRFGDRRCPTAHAAALVNGYGDLWNNYLAVHRSGAIELGLGDRGGLERQNREGEIIRVFNLISIVTYTWAVLKFGAAHFERLSLVGPWHLTVAVHRTKGALLGNVGEGWPEPGSFENSGSCVDQNLLWHLELQNWPDEEGQQRLAFAVGDRLEDAWGVSHRRYLAARGDRVGRLDLQRVWSYCSWPAAPSLYPPERHRPSPHCRHSPQARAQSKSDPASPSARAPSPDGRAPAGLAIS